VYPVWCDDDGGWHEGMAYWSSYINRFTWWADVMRVAMGIDAFDKPYFSQIGYYPLYMQPPGTKGGGFGDLCARRTSKSNVGLMSIFAAQARNPFWQWYVEKHGGSRSGSGYIGFIRGALPEVAAAPPLELPSSRCFRGTGQAILNRTLLDAKDNVQIIFKSSPFGSQSHGYEAQNAFLLYAFGERLFIRTGRRDSYGSAHHKQWMWQTKSTNCITVNGKGQRAHSAASAGRILDFQTSAAFDYVAGEASGAYGEKLLRQFTRRVLFIKPDVVLIFDTLRTPQPATFEWLLHAPRRMQVDSTADVRIVNGEAACRASFLWPVGLALDQSDTFAPPPRPRIKLTEYHLTARTSQKSSRQHFVVLMRVHRSGVTPGASPRLQVIENGFALTTPCGDGTAQVLLRTDGVAPLEGYGMVCAGQIVGTIRTADGAVRSRLLIDRTQPVQP